MTRRSQFRAVGAVALLAGGIWLWQAWWPGDERAIRRRLDSLAAAVNERAAEGLGTVARAAHVGSYFTEDVTVDLGQSSAPIQGRDTLMALTARLQPGTAAYTLEFDDVSVDVTPEGSAADVRCAATLTRRNESTGERSIDARELRLTLTKTEGVWRIARATALDTLRRE
jgi:hypothetical protein